MKRKQAEMAQEKKISFSIHLDERFAERLNMKKTGLEIRWRNRALIPSRRRFESILFGTIWRKISSKKVFGE